MMMMVMIHTVHMMWPCYFRTKCSWTMARFFCFSVHT